MEEIEYKFMISRDEFDYLLKMQPFKSPVKQVNHYFIDGDNLLRLNHITVRVREYPDKKMLEIKYPRRNIHQKFYTKNENLAIRDEYSRKIQNFSEIQPDEIVAVTGIQINDIQCIGHMTTYRYVYYPYKNVKVCLDFNEYLGMYDYELEIEFKSEDFLDIDEILSNFDINPDLQHHGGKCTRFLQALKRSNVNEEK